MKKFLQNATGQLKILTFYLTARKIFASFSFFPTYLQKNQRKAKFCVGEMRFSGGALGLGGGGGD